MAILREKLKDGQVQQENGLIKIRISSQLLRDAIAMEERFKEKHLDIDSYGRYFSL